jgi:hypothetical protein
MTDAVTTTIQYRKAPGYGEGIYKVFLSGVEIGHVQRWGASGRFRATAIVDRHNTAIPGFGTFSSGTLEGVSTSYHDGTFRSRTAAARKLAQVHHERGYRKAVAS